MHKHFILIKANSYFCIYFIVVVKAKTSNTSFFYDFGTGFGLFSEIHTIARFCERISFVGVGAVSSSAVAAVVTVYR